MKTMARWASGAKREKEAKIASELPAFFCRKVPKEFGKRFVLAKLVIVTRLMMMRS